APGEAPGKAAVAPDWFYVPGVAPGPEGRIFRSYVMWQEKKPPLVLLEFVSGSGGEERDRTPLVGKFWIYEQEVRAPYYGIFEPEKGGWLCIIWLRAAIGGNAPTAGDTIPLMAWVWS